MASPALSLLLLVGLCPLVAGETPASANNSRAVRLLDTGSHASVERVVLESHKEGSNFKASARSRAFRGQDVGEVSYRSAAAELIAMTLFVFIGCGSAMSVAKEEGSAWVFQVSLTFGFAITVLAYAVGHYSGAQINCAVTFGLVLHGDLTAQQGFLNFVTQLAGATLGAAVLKIMYPECKDRTGGLACNGIAEGWTPLRALIGEFMGTFLLMYVVFETAVNSATAANVALAPLAIGLSVFLAHSVLIPVDGCSINPTRSLGPALIAVMTGAGMAPLKDMWVFCCGPLAGAAAAAGVYELMA